MKKLFLITIAMVLVFTISSCAAPPDRYNTQKGAAIGAGFGALTGQIIGHNARSTLLGAAVGTMVGAVAGNAADQNYQASREASYNTYAPYNSHPVSYGRAVPAYSDPGKCRTITRRTWQNGRVISETTEEICEGSRYSRDY